MSVPPVTELYLAYGVVPGLGPCPALTILAHFPNLTDQQRADILEDFSETA